MARKRQESLGRGKQNPVAVAVAGIFVVVGLTWLFWSPIREWNENRKMPDLPPAVPYIPGGAPGGTGLEHEGVTSPFESGVSESENYVLDSTPQPAPKSDDPLAYSGELPDEVNLAVPFTPQAPHANWELPYQEACEEASAIMVDAYYKRRSPGLMDPDDMDQAIRKLVAHQTATLGHYEDTDAEDTASFIRTYFGYSNVLVLPFSSVDDLKRPLALGYPVIIPAAGQLLQNPYFTGDGPPYHMLVVRGYTQSGFITNDPGTRRGDGFVYPYDTILNATHDWTGSKETVTQGDRVMIVVLPN